LINNRICIFTNDVEATSIARHLQSEETGKRVVEEAMPLLLELYWRYKVKTTFFFTGHIAERFPEAVKMILPYGHEVGCHGYSHQDQDAFDSLSLTDQIKHLRKAKSILEAISGQEVISFRAPSLRIGSNTYIALEETGFKIDSSIAPQRADFIFSMGAIRKFKWLLAPRGSYHIAQGNCYKRGKSSIYEVPLSALLLPYTGTLMRISSSLNFFLRSILYLENLLERDRPIVFLFHPNECLSETEDAELIRRCSGLFGHFFKDQLRHKLKMRNLGKNALYLLENQLVFFHRNHYVFKTMKDYVASRIN